MTNVVGHVWQVQWGNPMAALPAGMPRVLAEVFVPAPHGTGARRPAEIDTVTRPTGYTVYVGALMPPLVPLSPERLARLRRQRLEARVQRKAPMFADELVEAALAAKPDYYAGTGDDRNRDAILAAERERYEFLTARPNVLLRYEEVSNETITA